MPCRGVYLFVFLCIHQMWPVLCEKQREFRLRRDMHMCPKNCCAKWEFGELEQLVVAAV